MKKTRFDAKGMACPLPVVKTRKLLGEYDVVETVVDNFIATQNLEKLAKQLGYEIEVLPVSDEEYITTITNKQALEPVKINALEGECPVPVAQVQRTLETEDSVEILSKEEDLEALKNFAQKHHNEIKIEKIKEGYKVLITKQEQNSEEKNQYALKDDSYIVVINKKIMGHGSEELGKKLIKSYFYALTEQELLPKKIIFYNEGAYLVDRQKSHVLDELAELEEGGVEILCCGACIDYHKIDLAVGNPTNMYFIVEDMRKANKILQP